MISVEDMALEETKLVVPEGTGNIISSFLRQWACRGEASWQIIGYYLTDKANSFGLTGGVHYSSLEVLKGKFFIDGEMHPTVQPDVSGDKPLARVVTFEAKQDMYVAENMRIQGLGHLGLNTIKVALYHGFGVRKVEQNYTVIESLVGNDVRDFIVLPSKHGVTDTFTFSVSSEGYGTDIITVRATKGSLQRAVKTACSCLNGLTIK